MSGSGTYIADFEETGGGTDRLVLNLTGTPGTQFYVGGLNGFVTPAETLAASQEQFTIYGTFNAGVEYFGLVDLTQGGSVEVTSAIYQGVTTAVDQTATYGDQINETIVGAPPVAVQSFGSGPDSLTLYISSPTPDNQFYIGGAFGVTPWLLASTAVEEIVLYGSFTGTSAYVGLVDGTPGSTIDVDAAVFQGVTTAASPTLVATYGDQISTTISGQVAAPAPPTAPPSSGGIGATSLVTYNWNPTTQLANFLADPTGASIVFVGDSTTLGFGGTPSDEGYVGTTAMPAEVTAYLNADGIAAQDDNFEGQGNELGSTPDARVTLVGQASWSFPMLAGGELLAATNPGDGVTFSPVTPTAYTQATISYLSLGSGTLDISVNGGATIDQIALGNSDTVTSQTIDLPAGTSISSITAVTANGNPAYIEGISLSGGATPAAQVYDLGIGGAESSIVGSGSNATGVYTVTPISASTVLQPTVAFINYGINDMLQGNLTAAQTTANLALIVQEYQAAGTEPVIVIPQAIDSATYTAEIGTLQSDIYALAAQDNVPVIDLSATYGTDWQALSNAGLMSDYAHPDATFYSDIGKGIAALLAAAAQSK